MHAGRFVMGVGPNFGGEFSSLNQCVAGRAQLRPKSDELVGVTQLECRRHGVSALLDATSHLCEENAEVNMKPTKGWIRRTLVDPNVEGYGVSYVERWCAH